MADFNVEDLIEVDDSELADGGGINTTELEIETTETKKDPKTQTKQVNEADLIEVEDTELEETTEPVPPDNTDGDGVVDNDDTDVNQFHAFAQLLKDKGVFPDLEDAKLNGIEDVDAIITALNEQLGVVNNRWKDEYVQQNLISNLIKDGYIKADQVIHSDKLPTAEEITGNDTLADQTLRNYYSKVGLPATQVNSILETIVDKEEEALKVLPLMEQAVVKRKQDMAASIKAQEEKQQQQNLSFNQQLQQTVNGYKEFIPGRVLTEADKNAVAKSIPSVMDKINKDTARYMPILAFLDKYGMLDGKMDKIINEATTKKVSEFEKIMTSKKRGGSSKGNSSTRGGSRLATNQGVYQ